MLRLTHILAALLAAWPALACAAQDTYNEPLNAYKSELNRDPPDVQNSNFHSTLATSQAKRSLNGANDIGGVVVDNAQTATRSTARADPAGSLNFASPRIYGNVRGNINIVVERNAVRGDITSVRR